MSQVNSTQSRPDLTSWIVCSGCTCLCDDILKPNFSQSSASDELLRESNLCNRGLDWFKSLNSNSRTSVLGKQASLEAAIDEARKLIAQAKSPLICGLDGLGTASQSSAWRLADRIRATIDVSLSHAGRGGMNALQRVGRVTATMGEVAQRSDFILLWFVDPQQTHPRLWERVIRPQNSPHRVVVVVDESETASARQATQFIRLNRKLGTPVLSVLRALLTGSPLNHDAVMEQTGLDDSQLRNLMNQIVNSNYGALFSKAGRDSDFDSESESLAKLIRVVNETTRFVNLSIRNDHNAQSAENVLAWSCGFASSVNLNRGFPRSCFTEHSAETILSDRSCDLILLASTVGFEESWMKLSPAAQSHFTHKPTIALNELGVSPCEKKFQPHVEISVSRPGFTDAGDFCRLDDVLIPLSPIPLWQLESASGFASAGEVLDRLSD